MSSEDLINVCVPATIYLHCSVRKHCLQIKEAQHLHLLLLCVHLSRTDCYFLLYYVAP